MTSPKDGKSETSALDETQLALAMFGLNEARQTIESQLVELTRLRDRALSQLGFGSVLATFVLTAILQSSPGREGPFYAIMATSTSLAVISIYLAWRVWATIDWSSKISGVVLVADYARDPSFENLQVLAGYYEEARLGNEKSLAAKRLQLYRATTATGALIGCLIIGLWILV